MIAGEPVIDIGPWNDERVVIACGRTTIFQNVIQLRVQSIHFTACELHFGHGSRLTSLNCTFSSIAQTSRPHLVIDNTTLMIDESQFTQGGVRATNSDLNISSTSFESCNSALGDHYFWEVAEQKYMIVFLSTTPQNMEVCCMVLEIQL